MLESFIADFENICGWLAQFAPIRRNLRQNLAQFAPIGRNLRQIAQFAPIGRNLRRSGAICAKLRNLRRSGAICAKLRNFSTIAPLDIKWRARCSKTWALLLYYYSRFLRGGARKLLARPGFEAVSTLGWVHRRTPSQSRY